MCRGPGYLRHHGEFRCFGHSTLCAARTRGVGCHGRWNGAPPLEVVVGAEVHAAILKALSLAGFGRKRVTIVEVDGQGRMRTDKLPRLSERTILCIQAGNVNSGAFDPDR